MHSEILDVQFQNFGQQPGGMVTIWMRVDHMLYHSGTVRPGATSNEFLTRGLVPAVDDYYLIAGQRVAVAQRDRIPAALAVADGQLINSTIWSWVVNSVKKRVESEYDKVRSWTW